MLLVPLMQAESPQKLQVVPFAAADTAMAEMTSDQGPIRPDPCSEPCRARSSWRREPSSPLSFSGHPGLGARGRIGDA